MQLDELSKELLARYKKKAAEQASAADKAGDFEKGNKRFSGIVKATKKQFDKPKTESRLDKDGTPVAELTPESTKLKEQSMNPMDLYLNAIENGVGVLTTTQEVVESVKAKQELDEAKIPVQHATDVVHGILGQSGAVRFLNHLRPGTEKHTSWDKINASLTKQGVKSQHIADIASKLKPAQYKEEVELDDEEAERKAKFKAALAATDHVAKGGMQKKGYTGSTYNPQKKVQKEEVELDEAMKPLPRRHFFQSYGVEGHGIAHDGKENHWKFENNKPVAHTKDPEVVAGWKRDLAAKSRANEEVELEEAIKLNSKVTIHDPGKSHHGKVGYVGEIRHGAYKGAPKTYTVDYDHNEETGRSKSIQLDKKNIKQVKEEVELDEEQKIKVSDIKAALKNVKNASDHTKKMIKANPTQKMPHDSSRHAAYSEETKLTFAQFITQMSEAVKVKDKDVITSGKNKIALHQGEEDGSRVAEELKGNQHKLDKNKNGKLDAHDFKLLRKEEQELDESILGDKNDGAYKAGHQPKGRVVKGKSYGAEYNDDEDEKKAAPSGEKRGRGRPKKGADQSGEVKKYNFHDLLNRLSR